MLSKKIIAIANKISKDWRNIVVDLKSDGVSVNQSVRNQINKRLYEISKIYHRAIPLKEIFDILDNAGIIAIQEDGTPWDGILAGRDATARFDLALELPTDEYKLIKNIMLNLSWHKMESGNYEINAYLS